MLYTFDGIITEIENKLSLLSNWRTTLYFGVYRRLIDAVAYAIEKFVYLAEFLYRESHWTTALKKRSLMLKAKFLDYTATRKKAPNGNLILTGSSSGFFEDYTYTGNTTIINKWDEFTNTTGDTTVFCTTQTTYSNGTEVIKQTFDAGVVTEETSTTVGLPMTNASTYYSSGDIIKVAGTSNYNGYHTISSISSTKIIITATYIAETFDGTEYAVGGFTFIPVKQGTPKTYLYTASGDTNEVITIYSDSIDNDEIEVFIVDSDGTTVLNNVSIIGVDTDETEAYFLSDTDNYYVKVENSYDFESVTFTFGDDIYTKKLPSGTYVLIKYAETDGEDGNIANTGIINTISTALTDTDGNSVTLYVTNDEAISDGSDIEDIESIRNNAVNLFSAGYRCGGYNDWINVLEGHSNIYKAKVWSTDDVADDTITSNQNKVYAVAISADGDELTASQQQDITVNYLKDLKSPTEIIQWQPLNKIYVMTRTTATIATVARATVTSEIFTTLDAQYGTLNTDFATEVYESNIIRIIDALSNILRHTTEVYNCEEIDSNVKLNFPISVYNSSTTATSVIKVVEDTLELWVQTYDGSTWSSPDRVAYDSGGVWVAESEYTLTDTNITYGSSQVSFNISGGLTGTIGTDYKLFMSYKTQDDNGDRKNDIRFPSSDFITDVDSDFVFTEDTSGNSTLSYETS